MERENEATKLARKRYDRIAPLFDVMEFLSERFRFGTWRKLLWSKVEGTQILEVGVGTGKNVPYYPPGATMTAIDFSEKMLLRARKLAEKEDRSVRLHLMDVQAMAFPDDSFDTVAATFVFCSVPDPVQGLREIGRVAKPGGKVLLLEHVLSDNRLASRIMDFVNPLVVRIMGANINRRTVDNVARSGLTVEQVTELGGGIFKLIEARKRESS